MVIAIIGVPLLSLGLYSRPSITARIAPFIILLIAAVAISAKKELAGIAKRVGEIRIQFVDGQILFHSASGKTQIEIESIKTVILQRGLHRLNSVVIRTISGQVFKVDEIDDLEGFATVLSTFVGENRVKGAKWLHL